MPKVKNKGGITSPRGDIGAMRAEYAATAGCTFKNGGRVMKASSAFKGMKVNASKEGNSPR